MNNNQDLTQQLGDALNIDNGANVDTHATDNDQTPGTQTEPQAQPTTTEPAQNQTQTDGAKTEQDNPTQKESSTIKQMREQIRLAKEEATKQKALLDRIAKSNGTTLEELEEKIKAEEDKQFAANKGISPEIASTIRRQEERIRQLEEDNRAKDFNMRANNLIAKNGITEEQFLTFAKTAQANGFDIRTPGVNLEVLYRAINYDAIVSARDAEVRQKVLNDIQAQREKGNSLPKVNSNPVNTTKQTVDNTDNEAFFNALFNK